MGINNRLVSRVLNRGVSTWLAASLALFAVGCGGGGGGGNASGGGVGAPGGGAVAPAAATVGLVLTDNPVEGYDQALATINSIDLIGDGGTVPLYDGDPVVIDFLALRDYQELFAVADDVPAGTYSKIRLRLDAFELIKLDDMGAVTESTNVRLVANGKVDLNPREDFEVAAGDTLFVTLDFDIEKSLKLTFAGKKKQPKLRPVVFVDVTRKEPPPRISRIRGVVDRIDLANARLRLCEVERISQQLIWNRDLTLDACVMITTGDMTAVFDADGLPINVAALAVGDPLTIIGRLRSTSGDSKAPTPDGWPGDWDADHQDDYDCQSTVNPGAAPSSDCDRDDDDRDDTRHDFAVSALLIERGEPGTFRIWKGSVASNYDAADDQFDLAFSSGQGFSAGSTIATQLFPKSRVISRQGALLERNEIAVGKAAAADGVIDLAGAAPELRAALVVLDGESPTSELVTGSIVGIDAVAGTITVSTADGQTCINVTAAEIILESPPATDMIAETPYTDFDIFGPTGTARHFEFRYGDGDRTGGPFEAGVVDGTTLGAVTQLDWENGQPQAFTVTHVASSGALTLEIGGRTLVQELVPDEGYGRISILAKGSSVEGQETTIADLQFDGMAVAAAPLTAGQNQKSGVFLSGALFKDFTITGSITYSWAGEPPTPAALQAFIGVADADDGVASKPGTIEDLEVGQTISAFGAAGSGDCFAADTVVVTVEPQALL